MHILPMEILLMILRLSGPQTAARCAVVSKAIRRVALIPLFQCVDLNRDPIHTAAFCTHILSSDGQNYLPLLRHLTVHTRTFLFPQLEPPTLREREQDPSETLSLQLFSSVLCKLADLKTLLTLHLDNAPSQVTRMPAFNEDFLLTRVRTATFLIHLPSQARFTNITSLALKHLGLSAAKEMKTSALFPSLTSLSAPLHIFDAFSHRHPLVQVTIRDNLHHRTRPDWISSSAHISTLFSALQRVHVQSLVIGFVVVGDIRMEHCFDRLRQTAPTLQCLFITLRAPARMEETDYYVRSFLLIRILYLICFTSTSDQYFRNHKVKRHTQSKAPLDLRDRQVCRGSSMVSLHPPTFTEGRRFRERRRRRSIQCMERALDALDIESTGSKLGYLPLASRYQREKLCKWMEAQKR